MINYRATIGARQRLNNKGDRCHVRLVAVWTIGERKEKKTKMEGGRKRAYGNDRRRRG